MSFGMWTREDQRKHVLDGGAHWHHMANTIQPSICGSDAALCPQITFDHLFLILLGLQADDRSSPSFCTLCPIPYFSSHPYSIPSTTYTMAPFQHCLFIFSPFIHSPTPSFPSRVLTSEIEIGLRSTLNSASGAGP